MKALLDNDLGTELASKVARILCTSLDHALEHPNIKPNTRGIHELCEALSNIAVVTKALPGTEPKPHSFLRPRKR